MAVKLLFQGIPQFEDANGDPYNAARLFFYAAGSSTKQNTYSDSAGAVANPNPITLNSSGYPAVSGTIVAIWGTVGQTYKIGLAAPGSDDPPASFIWTIDNVTPINDTTAASNDQWVTGTTPTFVSSTSFTLVGDQTSTYHIGRRIKTTNSGGTIYSKITNSVFGATTTVTVVNDSGSLDSGLSAVSYALLSNTNPSIPGFVPSDGNLLVASSGTTPILSMRHPSGGAHILNGKIALSVAGGALTIALKALDGTDPSASNPVMVLMPQGNPFDGTYTTRKVSAALSTVISSGSTAGHADTVAGSIYIGLIDNSGTLELSWSNKFFGGTSVVSTTAEGGVGGADSGSTMYSTTARTNVPYACIQRWKSTQTTAGTWAATTGDVQLFPFSYKTTTRQVITGTGTYTKPWDLLSADVEVQAGGGGGGGADVSAGGNFSAASGGGGGGYARKILDAGTIGATETATVGAGGTAGTNSGGTGGTGGTTSFGSHVSATGGVGGGGALDTSVTLGGAGGVGSSGDFNLEGADGANGYSFADAGNKIGGNGGSSHLGGGGRGAGAIGDTDSAGASGNVYGGGGGGAVSDTTTGAAGGTGGAGIIIVTEYYG